MTQTIVAVAAIILVLRLDRHGDEITVCVKINGFD